MTPREFRFTKRIIDALQPAPIGMRLEYRDTEVKGLCLRITDKGAVTFSVHKRVKNGRVQRITIGRYPAISVEQARKRSLEHISMLASGVSVADGLKRKRSEMTFGALFDLYYSQHSVQNKRSHKDDRRHYEMYLDKSLGGRRLSEIERADISSLHAYITTKGSRVAANRVVALISSVFGWGTNRGYCTSNPASRITRNKEESRDRYILRDEMPFFLKAVEMEENRVIADFVLVALFTGARRQNVMSMRWSDIDFDQRVWRIKLTKNGIPQQVALTPEAINVLDHVKRDSSSSYVFPSHSKMGHLVEPKKGWERILKRASCLRALEYIESNALLNNQDIRLLKSQLSHNPSDALKKMIDLCAQSNIDIESLRMDDLWVHDLRRTFGSWQAMNGVSLSIIGRSLNHQSLSTTRIYARFDIDPVREAASDATKEMIVLGRGTPIGTNHAYH